MSTQDTNSQSDGFRLSAQQDRVVGHGDGSAVVQVAARLATPTDEPALRAALHRVVERHEILRTTFAKPANVQAYGQVIHDRLDPEFTTSEPATEELTTILAEQAERGFDTERGPLLRAALTTSEHGNDLLVLTAHAAVADVRSLALVLDALAAGQASEDADPIQSADYAEWRHELISGEDDAAAEGRRFWAEADESRPAAPRLLFARAGAPAERRLTVPVALSHADVAAARAGAQATGASLATFLEAAWHALIARLTGAEEVVLAGWCDGRAEPELERAIGPYAQPVPVRSRVTAQTSFAEVIDQVRRSRAQASRWQDQGSGQLLRALNDGTAAGFYDLDVRSAAAEIVAVNPAADARLLLATRTGDGGAEAAVWYDPATHSRDDAAELAQRLRILLVQAAADTAAPVAQLALTDEADREALLASCAGPAPSAEAELGVHLLFEGWAARTPDAPAVASGQVTRTYGELNRAANRIAHWLRDRGVRPGDPVGLCMERTVGLLEALLGILKAGGAYIPLNYEHPPARLAHQLSEAGAEVLVTESHLRAALGDFRGQLLSVDGDRELLDACPDANPEPAGGGEDLAYVMYTSGSTGLPKGVAVTHRNLSTYSTHMASRLSPGAEAHADELAPATGVRFGVVSAISTDLGNTCIFPALVSGGCVTLVSPAAAMDSDALASELAGQPLDVLKITPSHLRALLDGAQAAAVVPRRWLILGGEALPWALVARIRDLAPSCRIINHYGPTETTIGCCAYDVGDPRDDAATVPIGRPLAGVRAYVLDSALALMPPGVPGELCIAGDGVARGYVGRRAEGGPFGPDPYPSAGPARMYRTGDRARYLRDGAIEFLGRVDDQVKIRGYRVEPGEVEAALVAHPSIRQAAVVAEGDDPRALRLAAYVVGTEALTVDDLRDFLAASLPEYMIPSTFAALGALPFTPSGKIDRKALAIQAETLQRREAEYVAPRTPVEQTLADIWAGLLRVDRVGVHDDFFALGGHSLLAAQVVARVRSELAIELPLHSLFGHPTVESLTDEVVRMMGDSEAAETERLVAELEGLSDEEAARLLAELGAGDPARGS